MNEHQEKPIDRYKAVATKISTPAYHQLKRLAKAKGMTIYDMLQMCVDTLLRYMSDQFNLSKEMEQMMSMFEHCNGWANQANIADPSAEWKIEKALYFCTAKDRKGARCVLVSEPFMGQKMETVNVQEILEQTFNYLIPERYKRLRMIAAETGCHNMLDLIDTIIDAHTIIELDNQEIRKSFEDADRAENNKPLRYGERTRRKKHHAVEDMEREKQQTIHFSPEDVPDLPELHEDKQFDPDTDAIGW